MAKARSNRPRQRLRQFQRFATVTRATGKFGPLGYLLNRALAERDEAAGYYAQYEREQRIQGQHGAHERRAADRYVVRRLVEIHELDDSMVEGRADHREKHGDDRKPGVAHAEHRLHHTELRPETDERRDA